MLAIIGDNKLYLMFFLIILAIVIIVVLRALAPLILTTSLTGLFAALHQLWKKFWLKLMSRIFVWIGFLLLLWFLYKLNVSINHP